MSRLVNLWQRIDRLYVENLLYYWRMSNQDHQLRQRLIERREATGMSQVLASNYNESVIKGDEISKFERGEREPSGWRKLAYLADRYDTSVDYFLGLTDDPAPPERRTLPPYGAELLETARTLQPAQVAMIAQIAQVVSQYAQTEEEWHDLSLKAVDRIGYDAWSKVESFAHDAFVSGGAEAALQELEHRLALLQPLPVEEPSQDTDSLTA